MEVVLTTGRAGCNPQVGPFVQNVGETIQVPDAEGKRMLAKGQAKLPEKQPDKTEKR